MNNLRKDSAANDENFKRSERLIVNERGFYYRTREGNVAGPFVTRSHAMFDLNNFVSVAIIEEQLQKDSTLQSNWG